MLGGLATHQGLAGDRRGIEGGTGLREDTAGLLCDELAEYISAPINSQEHSHMSGSENSVPDLTR